MSPYILEKKEYLYSLSLSFGAEPSLSISLSCRTSLNQDRAIALVSEVKYDKISNYYGVNEVCENQVYKVVSFEIQNYPKDHSQYPAHGHKHQISSHLNLNRPNLPYDVDLG